MKKRNIFFAAVLPIALLLNAPATNVPTTGFAVVELFTSEGCSSCPPADAVLVKIATEYKDNVYVLGYHVDYWDRLGWKDVYSNADYTRRQQDYAKVFKLGSIYTPEAVVNGEKEMVGSQEGALRSAIGEDLKKPGGKRITLHASSDGRSIKADYLLTDPGDGLLHIALVQSHAESQVGAGENSGRRLQHINIVRDLKTAPAGSSGTLEFSIPRGLQAKDCKLIAFLQENKTGDLGLTGAAEADIP
jgi:hypothetical protein